SSTPRRWAGRSISAGRTSRISSARMAACRHPNGQRPRRSGRSGGASSANASRITLRLFEGVLGGSTMEPFMEAHLRTIFILAVIAAFAAPAARAQTLVDPTKVAPEYREAAEKRRSEQLRQRERAQKPDIANVQPRDRAPY